MFKTIFFDLDDTILDFGAAERVAVSKTFREIGLEPTDALVRRYSEINQQQWECFERGEITRYRPCAPLRGAVSRAGTQ